MEKHVTPQEDQAYDLIGQRQQRLTKAAKLRAAHLDPYPARTIKEYPNKHVIDHFSELEGKSITVAGRVSSWREHGKVIFGDVVDQSGKLQLFIRANELENVTDGYLSWESLELVDIGDFVEAFGVVTKTQTGEVSLLVKKLRIITKTIRPIPVKLENKEERYRRRYLDFVVNPEHRERFIRKAAFWRANREFMQERGFVEVETPVLEHVTGGADARPFVTHHNDLDEDLYMRISTELYQKRLIGGGFEKIFTIGPNFRNEGISDEHLQEYYQIEWYWAYADYRDNMHMVKEMFRHIAQAVYGKTQFTTRGHTFDLADKWQEIDYVATIRDRFGVDIFADSEDKMLSVLQENNVYLDGDNNRNRLADNLWKVIRRSIAGPAFLINEPAFMSPLAKAKSDDPRLTERFHVILGGSELGNGYSEINDPQDQLERFLEQQQLRDAGDDEAQMLDIDYVEMLEYGMPPTSGYAHSERLFWFLEDVTAREGTLFPLMKSEVHKTTRKIYSDVVTFADDPGQTAPAVESAEGLPSREEAEGLLATHVRDDYQRLHAHMVAWALEAYAKKIGANPDLWYITGLLHDIDYYEYPDEHPAKSLEWFAQKGYPEDMIHAIAAHAHDRTGVAPKSPLAFALVATDELAGLLYAYSLMRETGFDGMDAKGARKKFKDTSFAAKVDRDEIAHGVALLNVELSEHIQFLIDVFKERDELKKTKL